MAQYALRRGVSILSIVNGSLNSLNIRTRQGLMQGLNHAKEQQSKAVVIIGNDKTFSHGADAAETIRGTINASPNIFDIVQNIESCDIPVIAALSGTTLSHGAELALACHYRLATPSLRFGFPDIRLGLIPGGGGIQRLTRLIGPKKALELLYSGNDINLEEAMKLGVIDEQIVDPKSENFVDSIVDFALSNDVQLRPLSGRLLASKEIHYDGFSDEDAKNYSEEKVTSLLAQKCIWKTVQNLLDSQTTPLTSKVESSMYGYVLGHPQTKALQYFVYGERKAINAIQDSQTNTDASVRTHLPLLDPTRQSESTLRLCNVLWSQISPFAVSNKGIVKNRMLDTLLLEAVRLAVFGNDASAIDQAVKDMVAWELGPFQLVDRIGIDNIFALHGGGLVNSGYPEVDGFFNKLRTYQVSSIYSPNHSTSNIIERICSEVRSELVMEAKVLQSADIAKRCMYSMVNACFHLMQDAKGKVSSNSLDLLMVHGLGFPRQRGGLMWWAEREEKMTTIAVSLAELIKQEPSSTHFDQCDLIKDTVSASAILREELFFRNK